MGPSPANDLPRRLTYTQGIPLQDVVEEIALDKEMFLC